MSGRMPGLWLAASLVVLALARILTLDSAPAASEVGVRVAGFSGTLPAVCTLRRVTGIRCPGCGLTRSFICLAHGRWREAWDYHPMGMVLFALTWVNVPLRVRDLWNERQGRARASVRWEMGCWVAAVLACVVVWLSRLWGDVL